MATKRHVRRGSTFSELSTPKTGMVQNMRMGRGDQNQYFGSSFILETIVIDVFSPTVLTITARYYSLVDWECQGRS